MHMHGEYTYSGTPEHLEEQRNSAIEPNVHDADRGKTHSRSKSLQLFLDQRHRPDAALQTAGLTSTSPQAAGPKVTISLDEYETSSFEQIPHCNIISPKCAQLPTSPPHVVSLAGVPV